MVERTMRAIVPVVLSGGSGTRLWPLSRELRPKQFLPLVTEQTLFQETVERSKDLAEVVRPPLVICNDAHRFLVAEQLRAIGIRAEAIVLEPAGRNTAPAVGVAALLAARASQSRRVRNSGSAATCATGGSRDPRSGGVPCSGRVGCFSGS
jgi:mannose-1-phosphate guanylyltransferase